MNNTSEGHITIEPSAPREDNIYGNSYIAQQPLPQQPQQPPAYAVPQQEYVYPLENPQREQIIVRIPQVSEQRAPPPQQPQQPQIQYDNSVCLWFTCCIVLFIPLGFIIGLCVIGIYFTACMEPNRSQREKTAIIALCVTMIINFVFWIIFLYN